MEKRIGILGAVKSELTFLRKDLRNASEEKRGIVKLYFGTIREVPVVLALSGVGKVNAALTAQLLVDQYKVSELIMTGTAGAIEPSLAPGDLVLGSSYIEGDIDHSTLGFPYGKLPHLPVSYPADEALLSAFQKAAEEAQLSERLRIGPMVSLDHFVASSEEKALLRSRFAPLSADNESAAAAHTAYINDIPFLAVRGISDGADKGAVSSYVLHQKTAAQMAAALILSFLSDAAS